MANVPWENETERADYWKSAWNTERKENERYRALGSFEELAALKEAKDDGRLVVLPCKVDDTVYVISGYGARSNPKIVERTVYNFYVEENGRVLLKLGAFDGCYSDELGKITGSPFWEGYYLTRAEAEKALGKEAQA